MRAIVSIVLTILIEWFFKKSNMGDVSKIDGVLIYMSIYNVLYQIKKDFLEK